MALSAPLLHLGRIPSLNDRERDEEHSTDSTGSIIVSRQWLEGFLAQLPHNPYPGPGDSAAPSGDPEDELSIHAQDLKLASSRLPGHRFARNQLVKQLLKQREMAGLSSLLAVGIDTTGFYASCHVGQALERKAKQEQQQLQRRPGSPTEAEMASARDLMADTLSGRVQAATVIQRAYRSYVKRKLLSKWFHSHRHVSFQRSLLSDRVWTTMARRAKTVSLYQIDERSKPSASLDPQYLEGQAQEEEEEEEEEPARVSHPVTPGLAGRRMKQIRRAFGSTFEAEWVPQARPPIPARRRLWQDYDTPDSGSSPASIASERSFGGQSHGPDQTTPTRPGARSLAASVAGSGEATPERQVSFGERGDRGEKDGDLATRWEATSASFLPPIQSGSALARLMKMRSSGGEGQAHGARQAHSMSGMESVPGRLRPISGVDPPHRASTGLIQGEPSASSLGGLAAEPSQPFPRRTAISARARGGSVSYPSSESATSGVTSGYVTAAEDGRDASPVGSPTGSRSGRASPTWGPSPVRAPRVLEPVAHRTPAVKAAAAEPGEGHLGPAGRRTSPILHDPQTSGTAIVMHGTVTPRKPSRMGTHISHGGYGEGGNAVTVRHNKSCSSLGSGKLPTAPKGAPDLNPKTLFLRWKEEERRRLEQRREMGLEEVEEEGETFVSFMQRAMAAAAAGAAAADRA